MSVEIQPYQQEFIEFAIAEGVLRFGEFTLKSGRVSPYFFNAGLFRSGRALARLGRFYASAIADSGIEADVLFGPAYKGIPLAASTAVALADHHQRDLPFAFNRKEAKTHGEGGNIVGAELRGNILIIDDVITAGLSIEESVRIIRAAGAEPVAVAIALDREETMSTGGLSALTEVESRFGLPVYAIARFSALIDYLQLDDGLRRYVPAMTAYRDAYGSD